jgi:hypothetical protein
MHKESIAIWFKFYKHHTGEVYIMDGKQGMNMKQLLKKVSQKVVSRGMEASEENILNSLKGFLTSITDRWVLEHLEISLVNSQFNQLYSHAIRNSPLGIKNAVDSLIEQGIANRKAAEQ